MIRQIIAAGMVVYGALACGPDVNNNYYGITPTGKDGQFSCADTGEVERLCKLGLTGRSDKYTGNSYPNCVAKGCETFGFSQDCIDCIIAGECVDQPGRSGLPETPWQLCAVQGICPTPQKEWAKKLCD